MVTKTTFVDFLQLRGEIRPVRSVVLTAPSSGRRSADRRAGDQRREGRRRRGRRHVRSDRPAAHARDQTVGAQAGRVGNRADRGGAAAARGRRPQSELEEASKAARSAPDSRSRATSCARASKPRSSSSRSPTPKSTSASSNRKIEGERMAAQADVAIARQKRDEGALRRRRTPSASSASLTDPRADRRFDLAAAELPRRRPGPRPRRSSGAATARGSARRSPSCRTSAPCR